MWHCYVRHDYNSAHKSDGSFCPHMNVSHGSEYCILDCANHNSSQLDCTNQVCNCFFRMCSKTANW